MQLLDWDEFYKVFLKSSINTYNDKNDLNCVERTFSEPLNRKELWVEEEGTKNFFFPILFFIASLFALVSLFAR